MTVLLDVNGSSLTQTPYDFATFQVRIRGQENTGPAAKEKTRVISQAVFAALDSLRKKGVPFRDKELRTTFSVNQVTAYNNQTHRNEFQGYQAVNTIVVTTDAIDRVGEIHDVLTSIVGAEVESPSLQLNPEHEQKLRDEGFAAAVDNAKSKFAMQCEVLGVKAEDYNLVRWSDGGDHPRMGAAGKFAALAECAADAGGGGAPLEFHAGQATVRSEVVLQFVHRGF